MTTLAQLNKPGGSSKTDAARTKIVIRRLPPALPEEIFWKSVGNWVSDDTASWKQYVAGRLGDEHDGHAVFSRAYVLFKTPEAVMEFRQAYDGHVFRSKTGEEYQAVVEYSPIQRTPLSSKVKVDGRQGTIEEDHDYQSFLESLKMPPEKAVIEVSTPVAQPTSTPLLDHLRIHGKSGGRGNKGKTTASSSDARGRAIASVTAAAAKRAPHADNGPILVAGKGREVTMVDSVPTPAPTPNPKKKGGKKREKGPNASPAIDGTPATAPNTRTSTPQTQNTNTSHQSLPPRPPRSAKPRPERTTEVQPPVGREARIDGEAGRPQGRPRREDANGAEGASGGGGRGGGRGRGGRGARRGGGADRGDGDGKDRSARGAVVSILTRNSETGEGRGGRGGGRGRGRGGGPGPVAASTARIDD